MKNFLILFLASFCIYTSIAADRIVIVGGGPVGLATAIEAITSGHEVTLIEKRDSYTRKQTIILDEDSLKLLQHWNVSLAKCHTIAIAENKQIGMVVIQDLEMALKERASFLGLSYILGQYTMLHDNKVVVESNQITKEIAYDILVGADGVKSKVREDAEITLKQLASAVGRIAFLQPVPFQPDDFTTAFTPIKAGEHFIMKIPIPAKNAVVICIQSKKECQLHLKELLEHTPVYSDWFEMPLQQARSFINENKHIIIVGDAAACASYLRGSGLNTGFQTARFAGLFFKDKAYQKYNDCVQRATDTLIEESRFLYN